MLPCKAVNSDICKRGREAGRESKPDGETERQKARERERDRVRKRAKRDSEWIEMTVVCRGQLDRWVARERRRGCIDFRGDRQRPRTRTRESVVRF